MALHFLSIGIYAAPGGALLADLTTYRVRRATCSTGRHGFKALTVEVELPRFKAFWLSNLPGRPHAVVAGMGQCVWEGRVEDRALIPGGIRLTSLGYWRALYDVPFTTLWSSTDVGAARMATTANTAGRVPERYQVDNNNRLFAALQKGASYINNGDNVGWYMQVPEGSYNLINRVHFDYEVLLPANWSLRTVGWNSAGGYDGAWSSATVADTITATGVLQTGHKDITLAAGRELAEFLVTNLTGAPSAPAGETGAWYVKLTNVRVRADNTGLTDFADEIIIKSLIPFLNAINPSQLASSTILIDGPGLDLPNEVYEDRMPGDLLAYYASLGDASSPPQLFEVGIWEDRILVFRQRLSAPRRHWFIDIASEDLEQTLDELYNSAYTVYRDASGATLRTDVNSDSWSVERHGLTRRAALPTAITAGPTAAALRDIFINESKQPKMRARGFQVRDVYDVAGHRWPAYLVRAWDKVTIRNLHPIASTEVERVRNFIVGETETDLLTGLSLVVPEAREQRLALHERRQGSGVVPVR